MHANILQGTLDLMILRTLATMRPGELLNLNQGTIYPALVRNKQSGWIRRSWGKTENNCKAKYCIRPSPRQNGRRWRKGLRAGARCPAWLKSY